LAFEACSEARASGYSGSNSGFMSELGRAWDDGARRGRMESAEMKSRGELNWLQNTIMFIFYSVLMVFITALPKTATVRLILSLVLFIPFAIRFWEFDYIMVMLVFLISLVFLVNFGLTDDPRDAKDIASYSDPRDAKDIASYSDPRDAKDNWLEEFEDELLEFNVAMLSEYPKLKKSEIVEKLELCNSESLNNLGLSYKKTDKKEVLLKKILTHHLNTTTKVRLIRLADKQGVSTKSRDTKAQIVEKILKNN
jgi:hypothetical protein